MKTHSETPPTIRTTQIQDLTLEDLMEIIRSVNNPRESTRKPKQGPPFRPEIQWISTVTHAAHMVIAGGTAIFQPKQSRHWNSWVTWTPIKRKHYWIRSIRSKIGSVRQNRPRQ